MPLPLPFSQWPISHLPIESQTLTMLPWPLWCPGSKINIFPLDDLDLDPITLKLKLDLDMVKMQHHTKNKKFSMLTGSKVIAWTDTQTNKKHNEKHLPLPHTWDVMV